MAERVKTRFAPSPTGFLHVGGARTALFAWLWARKNAGTFVLRIEDTDKEREVPGSIEHIKECLEWLKLDWDEYYKQSDRLELYKKYGKILEGKGHAYKEDGALRFKIPERKRMNWHDLVYGDLTAGEEALEDFVLIKSDGYPTYNFAHVVDDIEMEITHVMRGEEFIASTPKYLSLYEALGKIPPAYATLPVILRPDGKKKLSKRDGAKDSLEYRKEGYLPGAFINFLALLGWNPGTEQEIFTKEGLMEAFELSRIQRSGAKWNEEKLDWLNKEHLKKLPTEEIKKNIFALLPEELRTEKIIPLISERINKWSDVDEMVRAGELELFVKRPLLDAPKLPFKKETPEKTKENLKLAVQALASIPEDNFDSESLKSALTLLAANLGGRGVLLHPVRYALSGRDSSPDPFIIGEIIGKAETLARLENAISI